MLFTILSSHLTLCNLSSVVLLPVFDIFLMQNNYKLYYYNNNQDEIMSVWHDRILSFFDPLKERKKPHYARNQHNNFRKVTKDNITNTLNITNMSGGAGEGVC